MIMELIANTQPASDTMISGNWITGIVTAMITALFSGVALIIGKMQGRKEATETILKDPVPTVPTSKVSTPPTWSDHKALTDRVFRTESDILRIEGDLKEVHKIQTAQFQVLLTEGAAREQRIAEKIEHFAGSIHSRIDDMIKHPTPAPRPRR